MVSRREVGSAALVAASLLPRYAQARDAPTPTATGRPVRIAMLLYPGMTALDVVGPQGLLAGLAPDSLHLVARTPGPVPSDTGIGLLATTSFACQTAWNVDPGSASKIDPLDVCILTPLVSPAERVGVA